MNDINAINANTDSILTIGDFSRSIDQIIQETFYVPLEFLSPQPANPRRCYE